MLNKCQPTYDTMQLMFCVCILKLVFKVMDVIVELSNLVFSELLTFVSYLNNRILRPERVPRINLIWSTFVEQLRACEAK